MYKLPVAAASAVVVVVVVVAVAYAAEDAENNPKTYRLDLFDVYDVI